jgi:hypothetical protein
MQLQNFTYFSGLLAISEGPAPGLIPLEGREFTLFEALFPIGLNPLKCLFAEDEVLFPY